MATNGPNMLQLIDAKHNYIKYRDGAFHLVHGTEYRVVLTNEDPSVRVDATILIDGKTIGTFRINKKDRIVVERPVGKKRKLTFFSIDSDEGKQGGLDVTTCGTIKVILKKEKRFAKKEVDFVDGIGGTALARPSSQIFRNASPIDHDPQSTIIEARMVLDTEDDTVVPLSDVASSTNAL